MERLWTPYVDLWPKYVNYPIWITGIHMDKMSYSIWLVKHSIWNIHKIHMDYCYNMDSCKSYILHQEIKPSISIYLF